MLEQEVAVSIEEFVEKIKGSATYTEYQRQLESLKEHPDFYQKVNEFRQRNYELQNSSHTDDLFEKVEEFEREYENFRENSIVENFLQAELAFCRMMQEINFSIMERIDFDNP